MTRTEQALIISEIRNAGFIAEPFGSGVHVELSNRKISSIEVSHVTDRVFEDIHFDFHSTNRGVALTWQTSNQLTLRGLS